MHAPHFPLSGSAYMLHLLRWGIDNQCTQLPPPCVCTCECSLGLCRVVVCQRTKRLFSNGQCRTTYAKLPPTSAMRTCSQIAECRTTYAKLTPTSAMRTCSQIAECRTTYAKLPPTSAMRICSQIAECRTAYAKLQHFFRFFVLHFVFVVF